MSLSSTLKRVQGGARSLRRLSAICLLLALISFSASVVVVTLSFFNAMAAKGSGNMVFQSFINMIGVLQFTVPSVLLLIGGGVFEYLARLSNEPLLQDNDLEQTLTSMRKKNRSTPPVSDPKLPERPQQRHPGADDTPDDGDDDPPSGGFPRDRGGIRT